MNSILSKVDKVSELDLYSKGSLLTFNFDKVKIDKAFNLGLFEESTRNMLYTICENRLLLSHSEKSLVKFFDLVGRLAVTPLVPPRGVRPGTYSGAHLRDSKVFLSTYTQLVSNNEYDYFYRIGSWEQVPIQSKFKAIETLPNSFVFLCISSFDLSVLGDKKDILSVTEDEIRTSSGRVYTVCRID